MKKLIVFLSFFVFFSCVNKTSIDIEEKRNNENKKVELNVEEKEKLNVIDDNESKDNVEKILEEKEDLQVEEVNKELISPIFNELQENMDENGDYIYYSNKLNRNITSNDVFRNRYKYIIKSIDPNIDLSNVDFSKFKIENDKIVVGKDKKINLEYNKFKRVFKGNVGLPSIYEGEKLTPKQRPIDPNKKHIAFTFDDGPGNKNHVLIREVFNKYDERATFYFVGLNVKKNPKMVLQTYLDGHEISNHTYDHKNLSKISRTQIIDEILKTDDLIYSIIGYENKNVRPPYGAYNSNVVEILGGKSNLILWNVDSEDWKNRNKDVIISRVLDKVKDGDVVLFHDLYPETYEAIKYMVPILKNRGFQFVTYSELKEIKGRR
ncbi:MAG: polysaccharide deacetylase family protein [Streptobacillus sp.]